MDDADRYLLNPKYVSLLQDNILLQEFQLRYATVIDIYKKGIEEHRKKILEMLHEWAGQGDNREYEEDYFIIVDELEKSDNRIFQCFTIVSMYSYCETMLKRWLKVLNANSNYIDQLDFDEIKRAYRKRNVNLEDIENYKYLESLRLANNCIKHNDGILNIQHLNFYSIGKKFQKDENIKLDFRDIIQLADKISIFMLKILAQIEK